MADEAGQRGEDRERDRKRLWPDVEPEVFHLGGADRLDRQDHGQAGGAGRQPHA